MSNEWNATNPKIWESPPLPFYPAESSVPSNYYSGAPSNQYYNTPPSQPQYAGQGYQHPSQMVTGYSINTTLHNPAVPSSSNVLHQDASMVLQAVNTLNNSLGGLDIDPELINALSRHIQIDNVSNSNDKPKQPEIYSPTFNSPSPSPERKLSKESMIEVDGKKLRSSRPFYEQFNHYEDETENDISSNQKHSNRLRRSRSFEKRSVVSHDRTWAGSTSPSSPTRRDIGGLRSRSPLTLPSRQSRNEDGFRGKSSFQGRRSQSPMISGLSRSPLRSGRSRSPLQGARSRSPLRVVRSRSPLWSGRSRSPLRRTRSKSRERNRENKELKEKVVNLLAMSKSENRKFTSAQKTSSVLLVMNLDAWITDKVLWGAIHKYARDFGTKPPFYIERASFHFSRELGEIFLALIAFVTVDAAEMCMMHTKSELEVTGRQKKTFKMMYYTENTIMFDALGYKFTGLWRAVLKKRAESRGEFESSPSDNGERERTRNLKVEYKSPLASTDESNTDKKPDEIKAHQMPQTTNNKELIVEKCRESNLQKTVDACSSTDKSIENESSVKRTENKTISKFTEESPISVTSGKSQANIIKTNVLIGKMKSYLIKQNKVKSDKDEEVLLKDCQNSSGTVSSAGESKKNDREVIQKVKIKVDTNKSLVIECSNNNEDIVVRNTKKKPSNPVYNKVSLGETSLSNDTEKKTEKPVKTTKSEIMQKNKCESSLENTSSIPAVKYKSAQEPQKKSHINYNTSSEITKECDKPITIKNYNETLNINSIENVNPVNETTTVAPNPENREKKLTQEKFDPIHQQNVSQNSSIEIPNEEKSQKSSLDDTFTDNIEKRAQFKKNLDHPQKKISVKNNSSKTESKIIIDKKENTEKNYKKKKEILQTQNKISEDQEKSKVMESGKIANKKEKEQQFQKKISENSQKSKDTENVKITLNEIEQSQNISEDKEASMIQKKNLDQPQKKIMAKDRGNPEEKIEKLQKEKLIEPMKKESENQDSDESRNKEIESTKKKETKTQDEEQIDLNKVTEGDCKSSRKRKPSPKRKLSRNVKQGKYLNEDLVRAREREEEEAELFGKGLDKYTSHKNKNQSREFCDIVYKGRNCDRRDNNLYRRVRDRGTSNEDRFGKDDKTRGGYHRQNWEHQDNKRRGDLSFDDIDGNEESYWTKQRESTKQPKALNPWLQKEILNDKIGLSLRELKDPEFLLRVLLQTSIMIQNNQLTMVNPLDSLTPTDKELIIQTLNEIEATNQALIYSTLNDKNKFNAAENRVLVEALSNVHMFKAALLPPGSLNLFEGNKNTNKFEHINFKSQSEIQSEKADVYVQMNNVQNWVTKDHIIRHLRRFTLDFDHVKINQCLRNETVTEGYIKFKSIESASELLKRTNRVLYIGKDTSGIHLTISDITKKIEKWTCNSCTMRNSRDTLICLKCQKLKEKLRDVIVCTEVTNKLALINFKKITTVDEINRILTKIAPFLSYKVSAHIDSTNDQVVHFLIELPNPQACSMLKKCIRDNMDEFSSIQAGPRVAISFVQPDVCSTSKQKVYTFADVPRLAQYSASLYATNEEEIIKYFNHYTTLYTQELIQGKPINVVLPEDNTIVPQVTGPPTGTDDKVWPPPNTAAFTYDQNSGYYYDHSTGLYYEGSSQYFYNMKTGKFLRYDSTRSTYVLVQSTEISSAPVKVATDTSNLSKTQVPEESTNDQSVLKISTVPKESKIYAKKVMKDLVKWSKSVNKLDKKKVIPNALNPDMDIAEKQCPADVGFDILRKTEISKSIVTSIPSISSLIMDNNTVCEDEEEEYAHIDWKNFTCNLCHRVFNNADILTKHSKLSDLHRNNLKQWYISKNLDPENEETRKQQYRDRAAERRYKTVGNESRSQARGGSPGETWLCGIPGCMAYKRSGFDTCYSCEKSMGRGGYSAPVSQHTAASPDMSVGSQLLKKMGWESGTGLGKLRQGNKNPINIDKQSGYLGLGAQKEEPREDNESYVSYIKRSTQKRFQQLSKKF